MRRFFQVVQIILSIFVTASSLQAQERAVTLFLKNGESFACTVLDVWKGTVYFEATSKRDAYTYGEAVALENISHIRLANGTELTPQAFVESWQNKRVATPAPTPSPTPEPKREEPPPPPKATPAPQTQTPHPSLFPSTTAKIKLPYAALDSARARTAVGSNWIEPSKPPITASIEFSQLADLLAEGGMAGKLLYQVSKGELAGRELTESQRKLVDALLQSRAWAYRKAELREAHLKAYQEFGRIGQGNQQRLREHFNFQASNETYAFLEFVQFLQAENAQLFTDKWQKVEDIFPEEAANALEDILVNYEDWYYLYGQEIEKL